MPGIMTCVEFPDEDVQLAVIRTLQELARHGYSQLIDDNMPAIITLVADDDMSVREAVVVFLAEIARKSSYIGAAVWTEISTLYRGAQNCNQPQHSCDRH
jgi:fructoselysine-6-P-deglycase FrlB-like protein